MESSLKRPSETVKIGAPTSLIITKTRLQEPPGGVKHFQNFLQDSDPFLVLYGDILTTQDFRPLIAFHKEKKALGTIIVHQRSKSNSMVFSDQKGCVRAFLERPSPEQEQEWRQVYAPESPDVWVNSGLYCLASEVLNLIPANQYCDFPRDVFPHLIQHHQLYSFSLQGQRFAIDTPDRYAQAQQEIPHWSY